MSLALHLLQQLREVTPTGCPSHMHRPLHLTPTQLMSASGTPPSVAIHRSHSQWLPFSHAVIAVPQLTISSVSIWPATSDSNLKWSLPLVALLTCTDRYTSALFAWFAGPTACIPRPSQEPCSATGYRRGAGGGEAIEGPPQLSASLHAYCEPTSRHASQ